MLYLNMIFRSDPGRYQDNDEAKITYAASFLSGPAEDWFQPYVNETTGAINFTWVTFVQALKNAFDDPDAYQTARRKLEALKQERNDCSSYLSSFTSLATTLNLDQRTKIAFFRKGLNRELQTAHSYNHNLPEVFNEFV